MTSKVKRCTCELKNMMSIVGIGICPNCGGKMLSLDDETVEDRVKMCIKELEDKGTLSGFKIKEKELILLQLYFIRDGIT